jgi:putative transposase
MFVPVTMKKAEKYAVNLRKLSEAVLVFFLKTFGCTRKVYNLYVDYLYEHLEKAGYTDENIANIICKFPEVTEFKKEYEYLKEVDSLALSNAKYTSRMQ